MGMLTRMSVFFLLHAHGQGHLFLPAVLASVQSPFLFPQLDRGIKSQGISTLIAKRRLLGTLAKLTFAFMLATRALEERG